MKKTILLLTTLLLINLLLGCNPKGNNNTNANNSSNQATSSSSSAITKSKITFLHYFSGTLSGGNDVMVSRFNQLNTTYELVATALDHEAFKTSIGETLSTGNPPDIYSYWAGARVQSLVDKFEPIDDLWAKEKLDTIFSPSIVDSACTYNGKKYLIPLTQHYVAFFYNKSIFDKLNLTPPKDWTEFLSVCSKIKKSGITPIALGSKQKWPAQFWFDYLLLRTTSYEYREGLMNGKNSYTDPEVKKVFKLWNELVKAGYFNKNANDTDWDLGANEMVFKGEAAMTLMGTWIIGSYSDASHKWVQGKDYDFFSFPVLDKKIPLVALGPIDGLVIPIKAVNKDGAKKVLFYLSEIENQKIMSKGSGAFAPNVLITKDFYTEMQQRILSDISKCPKWAFAYDLSTPPNVADEGLTLFSQFMEFSDEYEKLLEKSSKDIKTVFSSN